MTSVQRAVTSTEVPVSVPHGREGRRDADLGTYAAGRSIPSSIS